MATGERNGLPHGYVSLWRFAGLMLSYWCSARCGFCYVNAGPEHRFWVDAGRIVDWWQRLERLATRDGRHVRIHLTGGEPFGRPELLFDVLARARDAGLPPAEKVETSAFWATDDQAVRETMERLKSFGVTLVVTDADVFHQQFVAPANVRRLVHVAREILGEHGVRVRWWDFYERFCEDDADGSRFESLSGDELAAMETEALLGGRNRLNGRAAVLAAGRLEGRPAESFDGQHCRGAILTSKHVHIDPYGNVFPGVCCGIVLGNAVSEDVDAIYDWLDARGPSGPVLSSLVERGPVALIPLASRYGFRPLDRGYVSKCQLCYHARSVLYHANHCRKWLGPGECYTETMHP